MKLNPQDQGLELWQPGPPLKEKYNIAEFAAVLPGLITVGVVYDEHRDKLSVVDREGSEYGDVDAANKLLRKKEDTDKCSPAVFAPEVTTDYDFEEEFAVRGLLLVLATASLEIAWETSSSDEFEQARSDMISVLSSVRRPIFRFRDLGRFKGAPRNANVLNIYSRSARRHRFTDSSTDTTHVDEVKRAIAGAATNIPSHARVEPATPVQEVTRESIAKEDVKQQPKVSPVTFARNTESNISKSKCSPFEEFIEMFVTSEKSNSDTNNTMELLGHLDSKVNISKTIKKMNRAERLKAARIGVQGYFDERAAKQNCLVSADVANLLKKEALGTAQAIILTANRCVQVGKVARCRSDQSNSTIAEGPFSTSNYESEFLPAFDVIAGFVHKRGEPDSPDLDIYRDLLRQALAVISGER